MIAASCIDAANPCVFVAATDLGLTGTELPAALEARTDVMARLEQIRQAASVAMGLAPDADSAAGLGSVPKVAMVAAPADMTTLSGDLLPAARQSLLIRMLSMRQAHRAVPVTGAVCLAVAARLPGSLPAQMLGEMRQILTIAHPSGVIDVDAKVDDAGDPLRAHALHGTVYRSARLLFTGEVCV